MAEKALEMLRDAIARNAAAVISLPAGGILRHCKSRFLGEIDGGILVQSTPETNPLIDNLIASQAPVGVACKLNDSKVIFAVPIQRRQPDCRVSSQLSVDAILLPWPKEAKVAQRRSAYRVHLPDDSNVSVKVWRISDRAALRDKPSAILEMPATARDLSVGGIGLLCPPKKGQPSRVEHGQRLRIVLRYGKDEVLVDGRVCNVKPTPDDSLRIGVQFHKREDNLEGRQALAKLTSIVGLLQREEVRRFRLGLSA